MSSFIQKIKSVNTLYNNIHQEIIDRCREGDQKAQFQLYKLYYKSMYSVSLRIVNNEMDAEDVMQEAFLKAFQKLDTFIGKVSFGAWLKKIVINKALDFIKLKRHTISVDEIGEDILPVEEQDEPVLKCDPEIVKKAIFSLPEGYRIVLSLFLLEGYDHDEISNILNISNATSRTQYHRAKKKLLDILKDMNAVS